MTTGAPNVDAILARVGWSNGGAEALLRELGRGPEPEAAMARLTSILQASPGLATAALEDEGIGRALIAVCGASRALSATVARLGDAAASLLGSVAPGAPAVTADGADPAAILRNAVAAHLLAVAAADLTGRIDMPVVGAALSELADAAAREALRLNLAEAEGVSMAVIALGKWGGRELNYASDIDLVFVHEGDEAVAVAAASRFIELMSGRSADGIAFRCDVDLRPEGAAGPLSRSLDSYRSYWERWAETWELQAMMKARFAAGDRHLGAGFVEMVTPHVFPETLGADAVRRIRAMKVRTEAAASHGDELKRGVGGIRDVEFAVQLLQLVHGRADPALRSANTIEALTLLAKGGYVRSVDADDLTGAYRWLRDVEHRLQMYDLRQTHALPADPAGRERVAKALGYRDGPGGGALDRFEGDLVTRRASVRTIHERLFYRPLMEAFADSPAAAPANVERQVAALGFTDSAAMRVAVTGLTGGLSRRSGLMRQLLPLLLQWLSEAPDPDLGLAQLHRVATGGVDGGSLVTVLRDDPASGERLCRLLGTSRLAGPLVEKLPLTSLRLGDDAALAAEPEAAALTAEAVQRLVARDEPAARAASIHRFYAEQLLETSAADLAGVADELAVGRRLTAAAEAVIGAALGAASAAVAAGGRDLPDLAVIGMGKLGGAELNYASDLDLLVVYRGDDEASGDAANRVVEEMLALLGRSPLDLPMPDLDLDLRPEGTKGQLARSLDAYIAYWDRWALTWEHQSLLRCRPVAGDPGLGEAFTAAARRYATPERLGATRLRDIRAMKARVEKERIPLGEDPDFHLKLGRGGMSDVEWTVQLLQMRHGHGDPGVVTPSTISGLRALTATGVLDGADAAVLDEAYRFCARLRNRLYHQMGRPRDSLPIDAGESGRLAISLGYDLHPRSSLREDYRRVTRRARRVVERVFYGKT
jgi:[glutamine synthetase] adenylyltransferase / [glutamine synthetase]-adenylyl-L-tyrosine phosphorylase